MRILVIEAVALLLHALPAAGLEYTAFSLKVARQRIEQAGEDWRTEEPDVFHLADINQVEGFVYDEDAGDLILVGRHVAERAPLTLDDLVVALRARFLYGEWPLVSIDPIPETEKTQLQEVRYEGRIAHTAFGQGMFDADYHLKRLSMGLVERGIRGFRTTWDRAVAAFEHPEDRRQSHIHSRLWFYPISPQVVVREGICVVRGLEVGVFTEVLSAEIDGKPVSDLENFADPSCDAFAKDTTDRFIDLCKAHRCFSRLRGLQELVAISKALQETPVEDDLSYWLTSYRVAKVDTTSSVRVLRRRHERGNSFFEVSGGVHLTALALRLKAGNVEALRKAVLDMRPKRDQLTWAFLVGKWIIPTTPGQLTPDEVGPLFVHALFLGEQERHNEAVKLFDLILDAAPNDADAWYAKGLTLHEGRRHEEAVESLDRAIALRPDHAEAWYTKGTILGRSLGRYPEAIGCFDKALKINPMYYEAWNNKGGALMDGLSRNEDAIECFDEAIRINAEDDGAWYNKALALALSGRHEDALPCFEKALDIRPDFAKGWLNQGVALDFLGESTKAMDCYEKALEIDSGNAEIWNSKAKLLVRLNRFGEARVCWNKVLELDPHGKWGRLARQYLAAIAESTAGEN